MKTALRVLACSDIHGNIDAVRRMRSAEKNEYDLIIIAGDIGSGALDVFSVIDTFGCPTVYVFGNHDYEADYGEFYGPRIRHLHENPLVLPECLVVGFSGSPTNWGKNPISKRALPYDEILQKNIANAAMNFETLWRPETFGIVVTHERIAFPNQHFPNAALMVHGHNHKFKDRMIKRVRVLNVAALDQPFSVMPQAGARGWGDYRQVNAGCYVTFIIDRGVLTSVKAHRFGFNLAGYIKRPDIRVFGAPYVAADTSRDSIECGIS